MAGGDEGSPFESTPSWIIGAVIFLIVSISLVAEKLLSYLGQVLERKEKKPLYEALQKIKEELMLLGFISLLLAVFQAEILKWCIPEKLKLLFFFFFSAELMLLGFISLLLAVFQAEILKWCIPEKLAQKWLPCHNDGHTNNSTIHFQTNSGRRLLAEVSATSCPEGNVPFISLGVLHYLHLFIFVLAVAHVLACTITVLLGEAKISQWRKWEETIRLKNLGTDNNQRVIHIRNLTFIKQRFEGVDADKRNYVISFFKHLLGLVTKADYEANEIGLHFGITELKAFEISKQAYTSLEEARKKIWLVDSKGLIVNSRMELLQHFKKPWAHDHKPVKGLLNAVEALKPTFLIGSSRVGRTLTKEVVGAMTTYNEYFLDCRCLSYSQEQIDEVCVEWAQYAV